MKKIAIFVEGQTEQLFVNKLLEEIAGKKNISIESHKVIGGQSVPKRILIIEAAGPDTGQAYYALIVDCGCDNRVSSEIRDAYDNLVAKGYHAIIGIRDVYPKQIAEIPFIKNAICSIMPKGTPRPEIVLATMEVEAWFLAEHSHFERIDLTLTSTKINTGINGDFSVPISNVEGRPWPSNDLNKIYSLVNKAYKKDRRTVQRTVNALDYAVIYLDLPNRVPSLETLMRLLETFFTISPEAKSAVSC